MCLSNTTATATTPTTPTFAPSDDINPSYVQALPESVKWTLSLSQGEINDCELFAVGGLYDERTSEAQGRRFAVCELVPREQWATLTRNEQIFYIRIKTSAIGAEGGRLMVDYLPELGQVRTYNAQRHLLFASTWANGTTEELDLDARDISEIWRVCRFISVG